MPSCPAAQLAEDPGDLPRHHRTGRALHCTGWELVGRTNKRSLTLIHLFMRLCREEESVSMLVQAVIMCHYNLIFSYFQVDVEKCADREKL